MMARLQNKLFAHTLNSLIVLSIFIACVFASCTTDHSQLKNAKVVVVHSFRKDYVAYPDMDRMILDDLKKEGINAQVQTFYLDCDALSPEEELEVLYQFIDTMKVKPEVILTTDDQATYSLLASKHPYLKKVPVVFTGVNFPNWDLLKEYPNVTGIWDKLNYLANFEMIEKLMGHQRIRFFYDRTYIGRKIVKDLAEQIVEKDKEVYDMLQHFLQQPDTATITRTEYKGGFLKEEMGSDIKETTFYFLNLREVIGKNLLWCINGKFEHSVSFLPRYDYTLARVGRMATIPTFTAVNKGVGYGQGILGGYFMTVKDQVGEGCDYVAQILKGRSVSALPIKEGRQSYVLDWKEMSRWGIKKASVQKDYHIINMPFSEQYKVELTILYVLLGLMIVFVISYLLFLFMRESGRKKQVQQRLREEKEFLSLVLEGGNISAWSYNQADEEFLFEKDFAVGVGLSSEKVSLDQLVRMSHPDDVERAINLFINVVNRKEDKAAVSVRIDFGGGYIWYEFRMLGVPERKNNHIVVIGAILCIQDFKENEQELIMARDLAAKTELKQSFLANMSHEIRTPLNAIVGFSNILVSDDEIDEEEKKEFITTINTNCELLLKLINDILEISRIESGNMSFVMDLHSINTIVEEVYQMNYLAVPSSVTFCKELLAEDIILMTDAARLKQVLVNFVNNAFKFTTSGHIKVGVERCNKCNNAICLYVEDTGIGIPAEEQKMIFERFYKCDEFVQGTGLGLSICGVIAGKLNGRIILESEPNKGSRFGIVLSNEAVIPEETEVLIEVDNKKEDCCSEPEKEDLPVVLIAEDSVSNYMVLSRILKKHFTIVWALNGKDALDIVNKRSVDLVLMDIKMQEMDGLTALRKIKKVRKNLPVIIQTAYAYDENREQAKKAGCVDFIEKPIHAETLMEAIRRSIPVS